jgi:transitional endoplasmic reticulum ATPase
MADREPTSPGNTTLRLRVGEARNADVGRAIARLDPADLKTLGVRIGDTISIRGKKTTVARAMPAFQEDRGKSRVQIDGLTRENAGAGIDDQVELAPVKAQGAGSVTLKPTNVAPSQRDLDYIGGLLDGVAVMSGDRVRATLFGNRSADFVVQKTQPGGPVLINPTTSLVVERAPDKQTAGGPAAVSYEDIGGLGNQLARIREMIELPLRYPEVFQRLGIDPPKGVLLHGPPGTGKTLIARAVAHETEANFYTVSGPEVIHKFYGESEAHLRKIWDEATRKGPSIIFLDEIDSIAPRRDNVQGEVEKRVVAQLLALMDGLNSRANVMVIAATNLPNNIDPALRRPGRFDREITIPIPDRHGREHILGIHSRGMPLGDDVDMRHLASITHGCVGADLQALCREAAMACLRTIMDEIDFSIASIPYEQLATLEVTMEHFRQALSEVEPSAVREVFVEVPNISWDDIGGLEDVKRRVQEAVEWPIDHPAVFERAGVKPSKGILLVGPPGVGKTMIAKAAASQTNANFISVKGPELMSRFVGESEKALREVFKKARQAAPCLIFFDEIDALVPRRTGGDNPVAERLLSQFLAEMDGVEELRGVVILAATNRIDMLDPAVTRPGRFDEIIELGLPDEEARSRIAQVHLTNKPLDAGIGAPMIAGESDGFSGAQVAAVIDIAARRAVRRAVESLQQGDDAGPRITEEDVRAALAEERSRNRS